MPLQIGQREPSRRAARALEARHVDLDRGLGEREEVRAQADLAVGAEDRAGERQQRALEVGERDVLVDGEALDLVELRRVRRVGVAAVHAPGDDDVERRRLGLHRPHLHRRRVGAQDDVEGSRRHPARVRRRSVSDRRARGCVGVVVQRVEVVVDGLDLGPLGDPEAEAEEHVLDLAPRRGEQVQAADRLRRAARQRDVDGVGARAVLELAAGERSRALVDERLERLARLVGGLAGRAALARAAAADAAQDAGAARPCARGSARAAPRAPRCAAAPAISASASVAQLLDALDHTGAILRPGQLVERDRRRHRGVQRLAAIGMWATRSQAATTSAGRPSRSAPTTSVIVALRRARTAARPRRRRARSARRAASSTPGARATGTREDRAHRRAHGLRAERVGAARPERDRGRAERERRAQDRADVARIARRRAGRRTAGRRAPPSAPRRRRACAMPEPSPPTRVEQRRLDLARRPGRCPRRRAGRPAASPPRAAAATRSSPSATKRPRSSRVAPPREPADLLELVVVRAGDGHEMKKGAVL